MTGFELFEDRMAEKLVKDKEYKFDPTIIITLLAAIIPLIQNCFKPTPQALRRRLFNVSRVATAYRQHRPELSWRESRSLAEKTFDAADEATDEELKSLVLDCCSK